MRRSVSSTSTCSAARSRTAASRRGSGPRPRRPGPRSRRSAGSGSPSPASARRPRPRRATTYSVRTARRRVRLRRLRRVEDELHEAAAVAQVDEDQAAVVAPAVHPAGEAHLAAHVGGAELAGYVSRSIRPHPSDGRRPAPGDRGGDVLFSAAAQVLEPHGAVGQFVHRGARRSGRRCGRPASSGPWGCARRGPARPARRARRSRCGEANAAGRTSSLNATT